MNPNGHADLGPELRQLAQELLDRIDPALRTAAAMVAARAGTGPGKCQQLWCPVCALAALVNGEEHPLLTVVAEHSVALLAVLRAMVGDDGEHPTDPGTPEPPNGPPEGSTPPGGGDPGAGTGRYQPIPITVED
ncbi:hypothetical protein [Mycolicibacterium mengxianglii]|uniref:hypothetical protein n=1 Tax=Mycolicibacterium mengxianglii TaxID=2736649 RepID=UPI0018EECC8A|nr:hypothetical protein [Mycolicibacterium mengxianglii]